MYSFEDQFLTTPKKIDHRLVVLEPDLKALLIQVDTRHGIFC